MTIRDWLILGVALGACHASSPDAGSDAAPIDTATVDTDAIVGHIAYANLVGGVEHLFLMDVDASGLGSNPRRFTGDAEAENYPSWSADGTKMLYERALDGAAIYVIDADGTGQRRLSPTPGFDVRPSFSPDGSQLVYVRVNPNSGSPPQTDIRVMNLDGTGDHAILADAHFAVEPRWSVAGKIVFMSLANGPGLDVYVMNPDGSELTRLTTNGTSGQNNGDPVWSADGMSITFGSDREGGDRLNVFKMNADGTNVVRLTDLDPPDEAGDTNWSSDNRKITFEYDINGMKQSDPAAYAEVWTMNADGTDATSTKIQCADVGCAPRWQPH